MKEYSEETRLIAFHLNPYHTAEETLLKFEDLDESCLIKTLLKNKIWIRFLSKLQTDCNLRNRLFENFPKLKTLFQQTMNKMKADSLQFNKISAVFAKNNIDFMLIKSDGSFPYESDNIDVLVKPEHLDTVVHLLENAGYNEFPEVRELNKYLFRQRSAFDVLPLHIHTRVEWEGTQFIDSNYLWQRSRVINNEKRFAAPSPEDCILITLAHLFFENHEVKLYDLLKIYYQLTNYEIDWTYMIQHSKKQAWNDAFVLTMLLLNRLNYVLYNHHLLHSNILAKLEGTNYRHNKLVKRLLNSANFKTPPVKIPYFISGLFFLNKVFHEPGKSLVKKANHTVWVASEVTKLRVNGPLI